MSECYCYELPEPHECNYCVEQKTYDLQQEVIAQLRKEVERLSKTDYEEDKVCEEADGCPTEKAVLQREWRRLRAEAISCKDSLVEQSRHISKICIENQQLRAEVEKMKPVYDAAVQVAPVWQWYCDINPNKGFEDSKVMIDLMESVREVDHG